MTEKYEFAACFFVLNSATDHYKENKSYDYTRRIMIFRAFASLMVVVVVPYLYLSDSMNEVLEMYCQMLLVPLRVSFSGLHCP